MKNKILLTIVALMALTATIFAESRIAWDQPETTTNLTTVVYDVQADAGNGELTYVEIGRSSDGTNSILLPPLTVGYHKIVALNETPDGLRSAYSEPLEFVIPASPKGLRIQVTIDISSP